MGSTVKTQPKFKCEVWVYSKNGNFEKKVNLEFKRDVKKMYYDENTGILKAVYENREKLDATHYYLMEIDVENNCIFCTT